MALVGHYNVLPPLSPQFSKITSPSTVALKSSFLSLTKNPFIEFSKNPLVRNLRNQRRTSPIVAMSMEAGIGVMGTKLGMMSYFETDGKVVPVTVVGFREGNIVTQVKTASTDGYDSVQVGYRRVRDRKLTKPEMGHLEKAGVIPMRHLQEFRLQSIEGFESGKKLVVDEIFKEGDLVDISGITIGKGFQGTGLLPVSNGTVYPSSAMLNPGWNFNNLHKQLHFVDKKKLFLEPSLSGAGYKGGGGGGKEFAFLQGTSPSPRISSVRKPFLKTIAFPQSVRGRRNMMFCDSFTTIRHVVRDSDCALSLLSSSRPLSRSNLNNNML